MPWPKNIISRPLNRSKVFISQPLLYLELSTVHGNEFRLFCAKAFPILIRLMSRNSNSKKSAISPDKALFSLDEYCTLQNGNITDFQYYKTVQKSVHF